MSSITFNMVDVILISTVFYHMTILSSGAHGIKFDVSRSISIRGYLVPLYVKGCQKGLVLGLSL
jgi:hypothetical protein